ncbi:BnaC09g33340D [Brassica napus]|uniref:(rape) hypothetical protein n=1 Tax=Brassica napus TaxID=3708 RepID=A0A078H615_BRANA|nr:unnamed protein product [Brassica napus]CDY32887.1 BnaC09g33340D [Brassica napus]
MVILLLVSTDQFTYWVAILGYGPVINPVGGLNELLERWDQEIFEAKDRATQARNAKAEAKAAKATAIAQRAALRRAAEAANHQPPNDQELLPIGEVASVTDQANEETNLLDA